MYSHGLAGFDIEQVVIEPQELTVSEPLREMRCLRSVDLRCSAISNASLVPPLIAVLMI